MTKFDRREFLKKSMQAGLGIAAGSTLLNSCSQIGLRGAIPAPYTMKPLSEVRIGFIGIGNMGTAHVSNIMNIEGAKIVAVCDKVEEKAKKVQKWHKEKGMEIPDIYSRDEYDYKRMCERDDIDLVYIVTPWNWHVPMAVEAMNTGKHAAIEVPAAPTLDACWELVDTSEKTNKHCSMMENCNYDKVEMMILNMVKKGVFGELVHAQCGYLHGLAELKFSETYYEDQWRIKHSYRRDGDLYPTHGLGPIAQCLDINRGNYFDYIVSMSSKSRGLQLYAEEAFGKNSPQALKKTKLGDVVVTLLKTMKNETIVLTHDTNLPRPYSRDIFVQGTKGVIRKYPSPKIFIQGDSEGHRWNEITPYMEKYEHPLWIKNRQGIVGAAGHGGMDYLEDYRLIQAYLKGVEPDMDVYDAAMMSAVSELSEKSIAKRGKPIKFPDFTRGMWKQPRKLHVQEII